MSIEKESKKETEDGKGGTGSGARKIAKMVEKMETHNPFHRVFTEYFSFRLMITPLTIKILHLVGMVLITLYSLLVIVDGLNGIVENRTVLIVVGICLLLFGNMTWRICCECAAILFDIHNTLSNRAKHDG
jgi:hypothetical protein